MLGFQMNHNLFDMKEKFSHFFMPNKDLKWVEIQIPHLAITSCGGPHTLNSPIFSPYPTQ
jgi:hypothetical protein